MGIFAVFGTLISIFASLLVYYHYFPAKLSEVVISNGKQTVVFLEMSHIATSDFYTKKQQKIASLAGSGTIFLIEGVGAGTDENTKIFEDIMPIPLTDTLYETIAAFLGLQAQDNDFLFQDIPEEMLHSVDLTIDDLVMYMQSQTASGETLPVYTLSGGINIEQELMRYSQFTLDRHKLLYGLSARLFMNMILERTLTSPGDIESYFSPVLASAILHARNDRVVQYIIENPDITVVVPYGALHFNGIFESLQKQDSEWKTVTIEHSVPYGIFSR